MANCNTSSIKKGSKQRSPSLHMRVEVIFNHFAFLMPEIGEEFDQGFLKAIPSIFI